MIVWFTGQPGAGKTTLAQALKASGLVAHVVDGDDLRKLMPNPGYDEAGRRQNIDRAQAIAAYLSPVGVAVAVVAPYRDQRDHFKHSHSVLEVFLHTDEARGREQYHTSDYEPPASDFLEIDTGRVDVDEALCLVYRALEDFSRRPLVADPAG